MHTFVSTRVRVAPGVLSELRRQRIGNFLPCYCRRVIHCFGVHTSPLGTTSAKSPSQHNTWPRGSKQFKKPFRIERNALYTPLAALIANGWRDLAGRCAGKIRLFQVVEHGCWHCTTYRTPAVESCQEAFVVTFNIPFFLIPVAVRIVYRTCTYTNSSSRHYVV